MKAKKLLLTALPLMVAAISLMTSCSSDDDDILSKNNDKGYTVFSAVVPGSPETRTLIGKYKDGKGAPFYWGDGDMIYVKDDDGKWQRSEPLSIPEYVWGKPTANFNVPGKFSPDKTYEVRYFGKYDGKGYTHGDNWGLIQNAYVQYGANYSDATQFTGDCGVGTAVWKNGYYTFKLQHKLAYLCLLPYTDEGQRFGSWLYSLDYASVKAENSYLSGLYYLRDDGTLNLTSHEDKYKEVTVFTRYPGQTADVAHGITVATTKPDPNEVAIYVPIFPGKHKLRITFMQYIDGPLRKNDSYVQFGEVNYESGKVYQLPCKLNSVKEFDDSTPIIH